MMEDSDILTLGWGCEPLGVGLGSPLGSWPPQGEEFVTLDVSPVIRILIIFYYWQVEGSERVSQEYATLEVAKERDRLYYNSCLETQEKVSSPPPPLTGPEPGSW